MLLTRAGARPPRAAQVAAQLRSLGVLQTCAVLKVGLPTRITYADLSASLAPALPPELLALLRADDDDGADGDGGSDDDDDDDDDDDGGGEVTREAAREQRLVACVSPRLRAILDAPSRRASRRGRRG